MTSSTTDPHASLRRGVYAMLIVIGLGAVLGRILAVDAIDKTALQADRVNRIPLEVKRERQRLEGKGISGKVLEDKVDEFEAKLRTSIRRPFLSGNDRSRWCTVRALIEPEMQVAEAPYAIDNVVQQEGWDTIDMVKHDGHLYSSKPTLLPTLVAGEYWLIHEITGASLATHPFEVGRFMLITINGACLLVFFLALAGLVERFGTTDWGRIFVMAAGVFGTFLTTFSTVLNNHLVAAACTAALLYFAAKIWFDEKPRWSDFAWAGFFAAFLAANELPAASLAAVISVAILWKARREFLIAYLPPALLVTVAFFGTNWIAHHSLKPAYMHRRPMVLEPVDDSLASQVKEAVQSAISAGKGSSKDSEQTLAKAAINKDLIGDAVKASGAEAVRKAIQQPVEQALPNLDKTTVEGLVKAAVEDVDEEIERANWYDYAFRRGDRVISSHWRKPSGMDRGEPCVGVYALHCLVGHHGILSLTPIWLMSICGTIMWLRRGQLGMRQTAAMIGGVTLVCTAFYIFWPSLDRNYGGMSSGFREIFWLAPAWLVVMLPAADASSKSRIARGVALLLLLVSVLSASYATWNPWTQPWLWDLMNYMDWLPRT